MSDAASLKDTGVMEEMSTRFADKTVKIYGHRRIIPPDAIIHRENIHMKVAVAPIKLLVNAIQKVKSDGEFNFTIHSSFILNELKIDILKNGARFTMYWHAEPDMIRLTATGEVVPIDKFVRLISSQTSNSI